MIGIDWGTTSLRAYRFDAAGRVLDKRGGPDGILTVPPGGFPAALQRSVGDWLAAAETTVLLCGMVGSRQGWVEVPYLDCPAGPEEIAACVTPLETALPAQCLLVPGLRTRDADGVPDVMRGEETKLVGLMSELGDTDALVCLPGTHSKWARLQGGCITGFATQMTGEVRAVLLEHSILGRLAAPDAPSSDAAFARGVARSGEPGGLLHHVFGTRGLGLMGELAEAETASYLSGLLIGHEIRAAMAEGSAEVHLAAAAALAAPYAQALDLLGIAYRLHDPDIVVRGLVEIGKHLG
jgi:2-dehydro-3-deoxygalactonokinase